ncbi:phospholipase D-like domain-containing protein [Neobacillus sp. 3P2-tot-E-2]|uniref:phospholipase D-like domain-containing protein n=1 Tax=Neobacillus sp. 3P2-tot-E-2 TaxID=3132212 RepID=UPI0039A3761B
MSKIDIIIKAFCLMNNNKGNSISFGFKVCLRLYPIILYRAIENYLIKIEGISGGGISQTVVTGSFNYTKESAKESQEILLTVADSDLASSMNDTFNELWNSNDLEEW